MAIHRILALVLGVAWVAPAYSGAESLGELAAREKERRKGKVGGTKVITENDLRRAGSVVYVGDAPADASATQAPADGAKPATGGEGAAKPKTEDELRSDNQKAWRDRLDKAQAEVTRLQADVTQLEQNSNIYLNPAALGQLEKAKQALAAARQQVETLDEERRRNGFQ